MAEEVGCPLPFATLVQVGGPLMVMASFAEVARTFPFEEEVGLSLVVREPVGVVAAITPWNYPLLQVVQKVAAALAAGCTVVLKPSELAPLTAFVLADAADEVGLPPGVLNVVTGRGAAGEALVAHPDVDLVSFTGSSAVGGRVAALAAGALKRVVLELGGKSANVVLDDADLDEAVRAGVRQCFMNAGQTCVAWSRMVVPRHLEKEAAELAADVAAAYVLGDPLDADTTMGPVISADQRARVRAAIDAGVAEGATLVAGGAEAPDGLTRGFFVRPTIFAGATNHMAIARDEVFGPVLAIIPHDGDDDAVAIANDSPYGLHGAVFSRRPGAGPGRRPPPAHGDGRHQRRRLRRPRPVGRLQAVGPRPGAGPVRPGGVPGGQGGPALTAPTSRPIAHPPHRPARQPAPHPRAVAAGWRRPDHADRRRRGVAGHPHAGGHGHHPHHVRRRRRRSPCGRGATGRRGPSTSSRRWSAPTTPTIPSTP